MTTFHDVYERIRQATNARTQMELAELLGIRQSSISDAKRRNSIPADWYMKLFEKLNLNPDWLKTGTGPQHLQRAQLSDALPASLMETPAPYGSNLAKSLALPVHGMHCHYEDGIPHPPLPAMGKLAISQAFVVPGLVVICNDSDAFSPFIRKGAYVGIDTCDKNPVSGELFALFMPHEGLTLKRLFVNSACEQFLLKSDQPEHLETTLSAPQTSQRMFGRVTWTLQQL